MLYPCFAESSAEGVVVGRGGVTFRRPSRDADDHPCPFPALGRGISNQGGCALCGSTPASQRCGDEAKSCRSGRRDFAKDGLRVGGDHPLLRGARIFRRSAGASCFLQVGVSGSATEVTLDLRRPCLARGVGWVAASQVLSARRSYRLLPTCGVPTSCDEGPSPVYLDGARKD
jgi:hypothetical protein